AGVRPADRPRTTCGDPHRRPGDHRLPRRPGRAVPRGVATMTTGDRLLTVADLYAGYSGAAVVRGLTLHVDAGEFVALLGSNGAGKSTTLQTISGLLPAIAGRIVAVGTEVTGRRPHRLARAGLAHVPEDRALFFDLTVRQ